MGIEMATINVSKNVVENITDFYAQYSQNNSGEYIVFFAKYNDINIKRKCREEHIWIH